MGLIRTINNSTGGSDKDCYDGPLIMQPVAEHERSSHVGTMSSPTSGAGNNTVTGSGLLDLTTAPNLSSMAAMVLLNRIRRVQRAFSYGLGADLSVQPVSNRQQTHDQGTNTANTEIDSNPFTLERQTHGQRAQPPPLPPPAPPRRSSDLVWGESDETSPIGEDDNYDGLNPFRQFLSLPVRAFSSQYDHSTGIGATYGNPAYRRMRNNVMQAINGRELHEAFATRNGAVVTTSNTASNTTTLSLNALDRVESGRARSSEAGELLTQNDHLVRRDTEMTEPLDSNGQPVPQSNMTTANNQGSSASEIGMYGEFMRLSSLLDSTALDQDSRLAIQERRSHLNRMLLRQHVERLTGYRRLDDSDEETDNRPRESVHFMLRRSNNEGNGEADGSSDDSDDSDSDDDNDENNNHMANQTYGMYDMRTTNGRRLMRILRERRRQPGNGQSQFR